MTARTLPSRVAAAVIHPPVHRVKVPDTTFATLGGAFPSEGKSVLDVQKNIVYVTGELKRWRLSFAIVHDASARWVISGYYPPSTFDHALECMSKSVTDDNMKVIQEALSKVLPPLMPWVGIVIQDNIEYADWQMSVMESCWILWDTVISLDLFNGVPTEYRMEAETTMRGAETHMDLHAHLARIDRLAYQAEHPWGWFKYLARRQPKQMLRNAGNLIFVRPFQRLCGIKPSKLDVPDHLQNDPEMAAAAAQDH